MTVLVLTSQPPSPSTTPIVFVGGVGSTERDIGRHLGVFEILRDTGFTIYYIPWGNTTRVVELRDKVLQLYDGLAVSNPRVALGGHSGGAYVAVEAAAQLEHTGQAGQLLTLFLVSLSPWYQQALSMLRDWADEDEDLRSGTYNLEGLGIKHSPLPVLHVPVTLLYGTEEKHYMHVMAGIACGVWGARVRLIMVPSAEHRIADLSFCLRLDWALEQRGLRVENE